MDDLELALARMKALQEQLLKQQGYGRPIVSAVFQGYRLVAVGPALFHSKEWQTFHDFLFHYIVHVFGKEWFKNESARRENRHPLIQWAEALRKYQESQTKVGEAVQSAPLTGAAAAYLGLSYNLYLLAHNVSLQERLVKRLKDQNHFLGANYETYVAATFIKGGFELELEEEDKPEISHVEFNGRYPPTGRLFSVEAVTSHANPARSCTLFWTARSFDPLM